MKRLVTAFLLMGSYAGYSQLTQYWADITVQKKVSARVSWAIQGGPRFQTSYGLYSEFITSNVNYKLSKVFTAVGGFSYFHSNPPKKDHQNEIRPWQGLRADFKLHQRILFLNTVRIEERWLIYPTRKDLIYRFRYQTGFDFTFLQNPEKATKTYVPVSLEIFEDLRKKLFISMERIYAGVGYEFKKNRFELYYINQQQRLNTDSRFHVTQNIARARWIYVL